MGPVHPFLSCTSFTALYILKPFFSCVILHHIYQMQPWLAALSISLHSHVIAMYGILSRSIFYTRPSHHSLFDSSVTALFLAPSFFLPLHFLFTEVLKVSVFPLNQFTSAVKIFHQFSSYYSIPTRIIVPAGQLSHRC